MKNLIKRLIKEEVDKKIHLETLCNKLTVNNYNEVIKLVTNAIGTKEENPETYNLFVREKFKKISSLNLSRNIKKIVTLKSNISLKTQSSSNYTYVIKIFKK